MAADFCGEYTHSFDQKHRLFIPSKLRGELGNVMMVTKSISGDKCLYIFPEQEWREFIARETANVTGSQRTLMERAIYHETDKVEPDKQGRITLRQDFCDFAELGDSAFFLGAHSKIEVWNKDNFDEAIRKMREGGMYKFDVGY